MIGEILQNRFQINSKLGEGGMGVVFKAIDTVLGRDVAVKILSRPLVGGEAQTRLLHEARAVAKLNHPNIVTVYDVGEFQDAPFIVMEFVSGQSLEQTKIAALDEIVSLAIQICHALEHAHAQDIVHRDVKPANVIVTPDGTAKLMDFGIARAPTSRITQEGAIMGTLNYMAPEQVMGAKLDKRADLYAFGVMLYELTTGRLPFEADNPVAVITQHLHAPVVPPRAKNSQIPPELDALILQLMEKEAHNRPDSAEEVRAALEAIGQPKQTAAANPAAPKEFSMLSRIVRGRLVGRKRELDEAHASWRLAREGDGQTLLISGEPGIGKTRLVQEIATLVEVSRGVVLAGECFAEGSAPYAPIVQMIREAFDYAPDLPLPNLVLADLITIAPELQTRYPDIPANVPLDPSVEQQRLFESFVTLCIALMEQTPLLLFFDDVHWADSGTLYLMRYLARRLKKYPCLLIATYREIEINSNRSFQDILHDLNRTRLATRLKLSRLGRAETEAMLEALFAEEAAPDFLNGIYRETEGNPFFIEEVCKALVESGKLYFEDGKWQRSTVGELEIPQSIRSAVQARVARLSTSSQKLLQQAAVIGREFNFELLLEISGTDEDELLDILDEAQEAQLIEESSAAKTGSFSFVHALIPATLRDNLSNLRRARVHRKVATVIETIAPNDYKTIAYHYAAAGDEANAFSNLAQAGHQARAVYANEDAVRYYTEALDLIDDDHSEHFDLLAARMTLLNLLGRSDDQLADIQKMLVLAEEQNNKPRQVDTLLAQVDNDLARTSWGVPPLTQGLAEQAVSIAAEIDDPVREAQALKRLGELAMVAKAYPQGRAALEKAITLFKEQGYPAEAVGCLAILCEAFGNRHDYQKAQKLSEEALALGQAVGDQLHEGAIRRTIATTYRDQEQFESALNMAKQALQCDRQIGDIAGEASTLKLLGFILFDMGQRAEALQNLRHALDIAESIGFNRLIWDVALDVLNLFFRYDGDYEAGLAFLDERLGVAEGAKEKSQKDLLILAFKYNKMEMLEYLGMYSAALELASTFVPLASELNIQPRRSLSWTYRMRAEQSEHTEALQLLEACLEIEPSSFHILYNAAFVAWLSPNPDDWPVGLVRANKAAQIVREFGAGYHIELAFALDIAARLSLAMAQFEDAQTYMKELRQLTEIEPSMYGYEQFNYTYSRVLRVTDQAQQADELLRRSYKEVIRISQRIKNQTIRDSWLQNVRYNREIISEAQQRGITAGTSTTLRQHDTA